MKVIQGKILAPYTSWQVGGPADFFCEPENFSDCVRAFEFASEKKIALNFLSGGSNVLVSDRGVKGLVIGLSRLRDVNTEIVDNRLKIIAECGVPKAELLKIFLKHKLAPALFLAGIPGDTGGGVVMNAGIREEIFPREFVELVDWIEVLKSDLQIRRYEKSELKWSYRHCSGWQPGLIFRVGLSWQMNQDVDVLTKVREANLRRFSKQPLEWPSCGSVFVNPPGFAAAQLIESCGLKGRQLGQAQISNKHANFIVNLGGAKSSDIRELIVLAQTEVLQKKGIRLSTEVVMMGEFG